MTDLGWLCRPIAHRGLHDSRRGIIENSASAIEAALENDYAIEVDLRPERDNRPIVFHDAVLDRLTGQTGPLRSQSVQTLTNIGYKNSDDHLLSFAALLEIVSGRVPLIIEVKSDWSGNQLEFVKSIGAALESYRGHTAIMSFDPRLMADFAKFFPKIPRGLVAERFRDPHDKSMLTWRQRFLFRHLLMSGIAKPGFIAYDISGLPAFAPLVARHVFGLKLLTWTIRTEDERKRAAKWADAIIFEDFRP